MTKRRILVAAVLALVGVLFGASATDAAPTTTTTRDVSVSVPMTCTTPDGASFTKTFTASGTLPYVVQSGRAFRLTNLAADIVWD